MTSPRPAGGPHASCQLPVRGTFRKWGHSPESEGRVWRAVLRPGREAQASFVAGVWGVPALGLRAPSLPVDTAPVASWQNLPFLAAQRQAADDAAFGRGRAALSPLCRFCQARRGRVRRVGLQPRGAGTPRPWLSTSEGWRPASELAGPRGLCCPWQSGLSGTGFALVPVFEVSGAWSDLTPERRAWRTQPSASSCPAPGPVCTAGQTLALGVGLRQVCLCTSVSSAG